MDVERLAEAGLRVSRTSLDLDAYRRDLWPRDTLVLARSGSLPPSPQVVCWPRDADQVAAALAWAAEEGAAVVPYGGGSGVCGGAAGRAGALVVDTKRLDHIGAVDPDTRTVEVGAGVLGQRLEDHLARDGWMTGHSPSSIMCSTVGGYVAARGAGQFSSRYGVFDDMLVAAEMVTPAGILRGGAWHAGKDDPLPLIAGSEGSLGVVTRALVRVVPVPEARWLRGFAFATVAGAWEAMRRLMQAELWPSVLRLYDPLDTRVGGRLGGHEEKHERGLWSRVRAGVLNSSLLARHAASMPLALPGFVNRLTGDMGGECVLIVGFEGPRALVEAQVAASSSILATGRNLGAEPGRRWFEHRHDVSYKLAPIFINGHFADTMEVATAWSGLERLHRAVRGALGEHALVMAHFSHAYPEGCSIYFTFVGKGRLKDYDAAWAAALSAARLAGGTVTHHHGVGQLKQDGAAAEIGAAFGLWRAFQREHDPTGIMNPGVPFGTRPASAIEPPPLGAGPLFDIDRQSLLATVDPAARVSVLEDALASQGYAFRVRPNRKLIDWLRAFKRSAVEPWESPLMGVYARFQDGYRVRLGVAPRSAAGPDLRWLALRSAEVEAVEVPIVAKDEVVVRPGPVAAFDARPGWATETAVGFRGEAAQILADALGDGPARGTAPKRPAYRRGS